MLNLDSSLVSYHLQPGGVMIHICEKRHLGLTEREPIRAGLVGRGNAVYDTGGRQLLFIQSRLYELGAPLLIGGGLGGVGLTVLAGVVIVRPGHFGPDIAAALPAVILGGLAVAIFGASLQLYSILRGGAIEFDDERKGIFLPCAVSDPGRRFASFDEVKFVELENWDGGRSYVLKLKMKRARSFYTGIYEPDEPALLRGAKSRDGVLDISDKLAQLVGAPLKETQQATVD